MTARLQQLARGRVVFVLEGGYKPAAASKAVQACLRVLLRDPAVGAPPPCSMDPASTTFVALARGASRALTEALRAMTPHWPELKGVIALLAKRPPLAPRSSRGSGERPSGERPSGERPSGESPSGESPSAERRSGTADGAAAREGEKLRGETEDSGAQPRVESVEATSDDDGMTAAVAASASCAAPEDGSSRGGWWGSGRRGLQQGAASSTAAPAASLESCCGCGLQLPRSAFAPSQLKRKKAGARRCKECCSTMEGARDSDARDSGGATAEGADADAATAPASPPDASAASGAGAACWARLQPRCTSTLLAE